MLITPAVAISALGVCFLSKCSSLWVRLRCQCELVKGSAPFNCPPAWPAAHEQRMWWPNSPFLSDLLHPTAAAPGHLGSGRCVPGNLLTVCKYALDMPGMSNADVPVAGDKFESKDMSGWRQLWATFSPDVCCCWTSVDVSWPPPECT